MKNSSLPLLLLLVLYTISASSRPYENYDDKSSLSSTISETVFSLQVPALDETTFDNLLSFGYYRKTCPQFESILHNKVKEWIQKDYTLAASLMRLHFHDCSVRVHIKHCSSLCVHLLHIFVELFVKKKLKKKLVNLYKNKQFLLVMGYDLYKDQFI